MSKTFFEKIDVFLPGQGEDLTQAPVYRWEQAERANPQIYYWGISRQLERGLSRYSNPAVTADGTIPCLYTNGVIRDRKKSVWSDLT